MSVVISLRIDPSQYQAYQNWLAAAAVGKNKAIYSPYNWQIPITKNRTLTHLVPYQVAGRIRAFKKPKSMVQGDIFPALFIRFGDLLAIPLCLSLIHI